MEPPFAPGRSGVIPEHWPTQESVRYSSPTNCLTSSSWLLRRWRRMANAISATSASVSPPTRSTSHGKESSSIPTLLSEPLAPRTSERDMHSKAYASGDSGSGDIPGRWPHAGGRAPEYGTSVGDENYIKPQVLDQARQLAAEIAASDTAESAYWLGIDLMGVPRGEPPGRSSGSAVRDLGRPDRRVGAAAGEASRCRDGD